MKKRADSSSAEEAGESVLVLAPLQSVRLPVKSVQKLPHLPAVGVWSVVLELGALSGRSNCLKHPLRRKPPPGLTVRGAFAKAVDCFGPVGSCPSSRVVCSEQVGRGGQLRALPRSWPDQPHLSQCLELLPGCAVTWIASASPQICVPRLPPSGVRPWFKDTVAAGVAGLAQADVESCIVEARARGLMPSCHFSAAALDTVLWRAQCYVQRYRAGGFMMILPGTHEVGDFFEMAVSFHFFVQAAVQVETARGRALGQVDALLVDCPWSALGFLKRAASLRGDAAQNLVKFAVFAAEVWIAETMDDEAAGDYVSCEEAAVMEETAEPGIELGHVTFRLQAHIRDLELHVPSLSQQQSSAA